MARFLYNLLLMSASGTIMFLLATLLYKQTKSKYARWYYALVVTSLLLFLLPVQAIFRTPNAVTVEVPQSIAVSGAGGTSALDLSYLIFGAWAAGAVFFIGFNAYSYLRTRRILLTISEPVEDEKSTRACSEAKRLLKLDRKIGIRRSGTLRSPLLFGILLPTVILPDVHFSDAELRMIFTHELTHCKHGDLLVKLGAMLVASLHWFNPCVYAIRRAVNNGCELCCDETVLSVLDLHDRKQYGRLLLAILEDAKGGFAYTTAMSSKQSIKQRLLKIVEFKRMPVSVQIVCVMAALSMTVCSVTAFGFEFAREVVPEEIAEIFIPAATEMPTEQPSTAPEPTAVTVTDRESTAPARRAQERQSSADYTAEGQAAPVRDEIYVGDPPEMPEAVIIDEASEYEILNDQPPETVAGTEDIGAGASRGEVYGAMGSPSSVSPDGSRETYELSDGSTAVLQYDGDVMDKGYILVD